MPCLVADGSSTRSCHALSGSRCYGASVQWPSRRNEAKKHVSSGPQPDRQPGRTGQIRRWRGRDQKQPVVREVKNPDDDAAALQGRIEKLEKAIEVLGADNPEAQGLVSALKKVRAQSHSQSAIGVRLDSCRAFVEREGAQSQEHNGSGTRARVGQIAISSRGSSRTRRVEQVDSVCPHGARTEFPDSGQRRVRVGASSISGGTTLRREHDQCRCRVGPVASPSCRISGECSLGAPTRQTKSGRGWRYPSHASVGASRSLVLDGGAPIRPSSCSEVRR